MVEMDLGKRIKQVREKSNLTQQQLADACGVGLSHIGYIERGKRIGNIYLINKIAQVLNVTIDYLVNGESSSPVNDAIKDIEHQIRNYSKDDIAQIRAIIKAYSPRQNYKNLDNIDIHTLTVKE